MRRPFFRILVLAFLVCSSVFGDSEVQGLKLSKVGDGYARVVQQVSLLRRNREYKFIAEMDGEYKFAEGNGDVIVEIEEQNKLEYSPPQITIGKSSTRVEKVFVTSDSLRDKHIRFALWSVPNITFRRIEVIDQVTGKNLLNNSSFEKGLRDWKSSGGKIELVNLDETLVPQKPEEALVEVKKKNESSGFMLPADFDFNATGETYLDNLFKTTREKWVWKICDAVAQVDKGFLARLEGIKKSLVKNGKIEEAKAYDDAIAGVAFPVEVTEDEPQELKELRRVRNELINKVIRPINSDYWKRLKDIGEAYQQQGSLEGITEIERELQRLLERYGDSAIKE